MDEKGGRMSTHTVTPDRTELSETRILMFLMPPSQHMLDRDVVDQCRFVYRISPHVDDDDDDCTKTL